jgi:hypothetical protein
MILVILTYVLKYVMEFQLVSKNWNHGFLKISGIRKLYIIGVIAQLARAIALQAIGPRFDSE